MANKEATARKTNPETIEIPLTPETQNGQMDALDSLPSMFPETPAIAAEKMGKIKKFTQKDEKDVDVLRELAFAEKVNVEIALKTDSRANVEKAMGIANAACKAFNDALLKDHFDRFLLDAEPMRAFMQQGYYKRLRISTNNGKDGTAVTIKDYDTTLPLARFVTYAGAISVVRTKSWQYTVQRVAALLAIRAAKDIGQEVMPMLDNYLMDEAARGMVKEDLNPRKKDPLSNTSLTNVMQDMLDDVLFIPDGKGHNTYRVVTAALCYFLYVTFHRGSKPGTIAAPKPSTIEKMLVELGHMMVVKANFRVEYEMVKEVEKNAA